MSANRTPPVSLTPRTRRARVALEALLAAPVDANDPGALGEWLEPLAAWLKEPGAGEAAATRLAFLREVLAERPVLASTLAERIRGLLETTSAAELFAETGLASRSHFFAELSRRMTRKLLPSVPDDRHLREVVARLFPQARDADWLEGLPGESVSALFSLLFPPATPAAPATPWNALDDDLVDAVDLLAGRAGALGLAPDMRERSSDGKVQTSPFLRLPRSLGRLAEAARRHTGSAEALASLLEEARADIGACREELAVVTQHLETFGTSLDLVFRIDTLGHALNRLETLVGFLASAPEGAPDGRAFLATLVREGAGERGVRGLVRANARLLSRKIIESAGATGEHYIAATRAEYRQMWVSAAGGGGVMAGTTAVKYFLLGLPLAPFFSGFAASANYAASFLVIQALHFTVATKQPAATAATLASTLEARGTRRDALVALIAKTTRSQLAAIFGNIGMVIPVAALFGLAWQAASGHPYFTDHEVEHAIESLHPFRSGTIVFSILTGFYLWLSSVIGGWLENWSNYNRVPVALARSATLARMVGPERRSRIARGFRASVSGLGSNVSLGFLLGMTPAVASFFGLPLEVRHITLSTGALTLAAVARPLGELLAPPFLWAIGGLVAIALLNFTVSFALAFTVAARACGLTRRDVARLVGAVWQALRLSPKRFVVPVAGEPEAA